MDLWEIIWAGISLSIIGAIMADAIWTVFSPEHYVQFGGILGIVMPYVPLLFMIAVLAKVSAETGAWGGRK